MSSFFAKSAAAPAAAVAAGLLLGACNGNSATDNQTRGTMPADSTAAHVPAPAPANSPLTIVAEINAPQITGVAVAPGGKIFAFSPRWDYNPTNPVALVTGKNTLAPYPDAKWCMWNDSLRNEPQKHWICPQAGYVDTKGHLWIVDPASPGLKYTVPGGPKLVETDPATSTVVRTIAIPESVAPRKSYLNDVRIDLQNNYAYMTESGTGALVVVDLKTGTSRALLKQQPSTLPTPGFVTKAQGHALIDPTGKPGSFKADGIALSTDNQYLYYRALSGHELYRIKTEVLRNPALSAAQVNAAPEKLPDAPACDGMEIDSKGNLYLTAFETGAILRRTPDGKTETLVQEERLQWPDTFAWDPDGKSLYFTVSELDLTPNWNKGVASAHEPFRIYKMAATK
ncbi:SMP-30/gluconolactonase/LRE family protein [Hymenobacter sp. BT559]|uniref:SMP-30/gluconolactonase/LRE family protein n=1 Tax=Hymenobacter sp. BT559 TaxID=2795729 RepID=UPI0018ED2C03|nr:L-dopachrome tautomerase-related protein [Hymenobacter sp. BT559]MBJ6144145.1 SMP-30/gluconolactonase/LRE family protein [Hymenobacter sp. BT559]